MTFHDFTVNDPRHDDEPETSEGILTRRHPMKRLIAGAVIALALLVANGMLTFWNSQHLQADNNWVAHSQRVGLSLERVLSLLKDAETGQRGYLITDDVAFLEPYEAALREIASEVGQLERQTADNPMHQARIPELREHIRLRLEYLAANIERRKAGRFEEAAAAIKEGGGKRQMDALRRIVGEMSEHEHSLLRDRQLKSKRTFKAVLTSGILASVAAIAAILALMAAMRRHLAAREAATALLAEQRERLRTTMASIGDGVITTDPEGRVTRLNAVAEQLTGWSSRDAKGMPLEEVFRIVNETTRRTVESPVTKALREGVIVGLANHTVLIAKDGSECAIDDSAAPIRCKDGEVVGCVLVFRDITERRQTERDLASSEARKSAILSSGLDAIIGMNHEGVIEEWNPAAERIFQYKRDEVLGRPVADTIIPPELREAHRRGMAHYFATGEGPALDRRLELTAQRADGSQFPCELAITATRIESSPPYFTAYVRDITDRKAAEQAQLVRAEELLRADRSKDEFLAMLAHELRNPLAPVRNAAEILRIPGASAEERAQAQLILGRQIENMTRMIDDLLDVSRITEGKIELRFESVPLASVLDAAVNLARISCAAHGQQLTVVPPDEPVFVNADATRLEQVFNNLLANACKYSGEGSHITFSAEKAAGEIIVRVMDDGAGIDPELLPNVFDLFVQSSRSLDRAHGGLGIGLTVVQRLVKLHGGTVEAHSGGLGKGSEFTVRLPILSRPPPPVTPSIRAPGATRSFRLLIVDDNVDSAESLSMLQQLSGHETRTAHNGHDALALAADFMPEVVILDIGLPGMDGFEVARRLRTMDGLEKAFLIAMTGYGSDEDRQRTKAAGFDRHLVKPADLGVLRTWLEARA